MQEKAGYKSISLDIAQRIVSGEFPRHSKISGRSLLAGQYHVSPETIRKAIGLLKEENIVSVSQGKEIIVLSEQLAHEYITKHNYLKSAYSLKQDLESLLEEKKAIDERFEELLNEIIKASDRMQNLKPYRPVEITIKTNSHVIGNTIGNLFFWQNTGATIIALRRGTEVTISPGPHVVLREEDVIVAVGDENMYDRTARFINQKGLQEQ
ncbi:TrkA C-terminal domain-containing protein [Paenibacillus sp. 453mf]|uniref:TrkA C-terminal domain-containing protein n=1 Tax=Paenibacillus sp. 453mf TaxID=1761874 RepID=UPI0008E6361D|nr:TrkA C-terminal domain-containing protein [Paenibacillus sp. 453mf]SFS53616.1 regulatory protein, gntR family [Paenibacillus sp. 453mf]